MEIRHRGIRWSNIDVIRLSATRRWIFIELTAAICPHFYLLISLVLLSLYFHILSLLCRLQKQMYIVILSVQFLFTPRVKRTPYSCIYTWRSMQIKRYSCVTFWCKWCSWLKLTAHSQSFDRSTGALQPTLNYSVELGMNLWRKTESVTLLFTHYLLGMCGGGDRARRAVLASVYVNKRIIYLLNTDFAHLLQLISLLFNPPPHFNHQA